MPKITRKEALSVPNLLTYLRMLLIPLFVSLYYKERYLAALITLAVSGLTDVLDGYIARRFNQVTELGKALDPISDKLTQAALVFCTGKTAPAMFVLFAVHVAKEIVMLGITGNTLRVTGHVYCARWYGKLCTAVLYACSAVFLIWWDLPQPLVVGIVAGCCALILFCLVMYAVRYHRINQAFREGGETMAELEADGWKQRRAQKEKNS